MTAAVAADGSSGCGLRFLVVVFLGFLGFAEEATAKVALGTSFAFMSRILFISILEKMPGARANADRGGVGPPADFCTAMAASMILCVRANISSTGDESLPMGGVGSGAACMLAIVRQISGADCQLRCRRDERQGATMMLCVERKRKIDSNEIESNYKVDL